MDLRGPMLTLSARVPSKDDRATDETRSNAAAADPRNQVEGDGKIDNRRLSSVRAAGKNRTCVTSAQQKTLYVTDARRKATTAHSAGRQTSTNPDSRQRSSMQRPWQRERRPGLQRYWWARTERERSPSSWTPELK